MSQSVFTMPAYNSIDTHNVETSSVLQMDPIPSDVPGLQFEGASLLQLKSNLNSIGFPIEISHQILDFYRRYASMLAQKYAHTYNTTCFRLRQCQISQEEYRNSAAAFSKVCKEMYTNVLSKWGDILLKIIYSRSNPFGHDDSNGAGTRHIFNKEFAPVLELSFQANRFPTRVQKQQLAMKSGMTYKQIDIWFQNRRNRSGKTTSIPSYEQSSYSVQKSVHSGLKLDTTAQRREEPRQTKSWTNNNLISSASSTPSYSENSLPRPKHIFPTPYPIKYTEENPDPFPHRHGGGHYDTPWYRKPAKDRIMRPAPDVNELTQALRRLTIKDTQPHIPSSHSTSSGEDRFNPMIVRPYPAPLPSLVRPTSNSRNITVKARSPAERRKATSRENPSKRHGRSKPSQLPKRLPSTLQKEGTHNDYQAHTPSRSLSSRTPSLESLPALSRSPSESSSSASSSDSDSPLFTPTVLPDDILKSFLESDMFALPDFNPEAYLIFPEDELPDEISFAVTPVSYGKSVGVLS